MMPVRRMIKNVSIGNDDYLLTVYDEDFSDIYPGMIRYELIVTSNGNTIGVFRTNTYEYSALEPLTAKNVVLEKADVWERELRNNPKNFSGTAPPVRAKSSSMKSADIVIIQGSPRPDGNCGIISSWITEAACRAGKTFTIIYPHDLDIHCCIGCYQCYNTGTCVFDDDMIGIIDSIRSAHLIAICSPVYTNTVPSGLKLLIDRTQAYHAERILFGGSQGQRGLLFSVAGRKGENNFTCVSKVINSFFENHGIKPSGNIFVDRTDIIRDIRRRSDLEMKVKDLVSSQL